MSFYYSLYRSLPSFLISLLYLVSSSSSFTDVLLTNDFRQVNIEYENTEDVFNPDNNFAQWTKAPQQVSDITTNGFSATGLVASTTEIDNYRSEASNFYFGFQLATAHTLLLSGTTWAESLGGGTASVDVMVRDVTTFALPVLFSSTINPTDNNSEQANIFFDQLLNPGFYQIQIIARALDLNAASSFDVTGSLTSSGAVPVPAAAWLFGSALVGLVGIKRKE